MKKQAGFTLIEVMVAILLMSIVALIGWRGLDSATRTEQHLRATGEREEALLLALNQLQRDLDQRAEPAAGERAAVTVRGGGNLPTRLEVTRREASGQGQLQRVRWWAEGGVLYRAEARARNVYPLPAPGKGLPVLEGVERFEMRTWRDGKGWSALAGTPAENPPGVEVQLVRRTAVGLERYRQVIAPLD